MQHSDLQVEKIFTEQTLSGLPTHDCDMAAPTPKFLLWASLRGEQVCAANKFLVMRKFSISKSGQNERRLNEWFTLAS
jgi:hypothetical protein